MQPFGAAAAKIRDNPAKRHRLLRYGGESHRDHKQDRRQNSQGALCFHMYSFSDLRSEYKLATKGP